MPGRPWGSRKYRSVAARRACSRRAVQHAPGAQQERRRSSKCVQYHVDSRRRKLNADFFRPTQMLEAGDNWSYFELKGKGSPYSITERRVPELIPVLGSQPAGNVSHKPGGRLPLLSARPAVTPATLKRAATNFAAW